MRALALIRKEFAQLLRDPVVLFLVLFLTTVEIALCTLALGFDVKNLQLAVVDYDRSVASRSLIESFTSSDNFVLHQQARSTDIAEAALRRGEADAVVEIPPGFGARVAAGRQASFGVVVDGSNATVAARARAYIIEIAAGAAASPLPGARLSQPIVQPAVRVWYNTDLTNTRFMALGAFAQAAFMLAIILPAAGMVREKQNGTLEQIRVTPIRPHELFVGKIVPPMVISLASIFPSLLVIRLMDVPLQGNLPTLFLMHTIFLLAAVAIGMFVATISSTLQQALLISFFGLFPFLFLSGTIAPIESMPGWLQATSEVSPLKHYIEILSGLFLKGAGMGELWPHALALTAISVPLLLAGWWIFRRSW
jgi:ABC-2 type transport system permease protein